MMQYVKLSGQKRKSQAIDLKGLGAAEEEIAEDGSKSTYLMEEVSTLARLINRTLKNEPQISDRLPINVDSEDLFNTCSDGLVLIYILKLIDPGLVNMKKVKHGNNLNVFEIRQNLDLALDGCR